MTTSSLHRGSRAAAPLDALGALALALFPALMLSRPNPANACYSLLLALACAALAMRRRADGIGAAGLLRRCWPLMLAMAGLPLALALHETVFTGAVPHIPYLYLRFALFGLLLWVLYLAGPGRIEWLQWGCAAGAIVSAAWIHGLAGPGRLNHIGINNAIPFGNLSLLMGVLALLSIGWRRPASNAALACGGIALRLVGGAAGLYASYLSGTRGGWIALPAFAVIVLLPFRLRPRIYAGLLAAIVLGLGAGGYANGWVSQRVEQAVSSLEEFQHGQDLDSSEGNRLQMWRASLLMFRDHPLIGVGPKGYQPELVRLAQRGIVTPAATAYSHSHNDVLFALATLGLPGLAAILATYLAPALFFARRVRHRDAGLRTAAAMGLALCAGFLIFGLTESMFVITLTNAFYSLMAAAFVAYAIRREAQLRAAAAAAQG
ncbi:hypothetical protein GCM10023144_28080 [Pigmentiphaga soli]|uniref:O-antigen ligase-related domain-containing protein n=1 Tax=Pigmentiphaga soli TaxID=1007095 RepID=A0ABP8H766_9BURK